MSKLIFAGIGSRETPKAMCALMTNIGIYFASCGITLRSGGADGADMAFENGYIVSGVKDYESLTEIYLPWKGFNNNVSGLHIITQDALEMAKKYHPYWNKLNQAAQKLMARNCYQVLGYDLNEPANFIVCWTKDGEASGGTGQALRIAIDYNIKVYNIRNVDALAELREFSKTLR